MYQSSIGTHTGFRSSSETELDGRGATLRTVAMVCSLAVVTHWMRCSTSGVEAACVGSLALITVAECKVDVVNPPSSKSHSAARSRRGPIVLADRIPAFTHSPARGPLAKPGPTFVASFARYAGHSAGRSRDGGASAKQ
jgi:hypothetical protein